MFDACSSAPMLGAHDGPDRRQSARAPLYMLVNVPRYREPLWATDIGLGGMQCRSRLPRWPGTYLDLSFQLPGYPEPLAVGGQVLTLDQMDNQTLSMGLRFCMLSTKVQRAIYRFLDQRRLLWDKAHNLLAQASPSPRTRLDELMASLPERPFESLLLEAYAALRCRELRPAGFVRRLSGISQAAPESGLAHL